MMAEQSSGVAENLESELGNKANLQLTTALMAKSKFWKMERHKKGNI